MNEFDQGRFSFVLSKSCHFFIEEFLPEMILRSVGRYLRTDDTIQSENTKYS